MSTGPKGEPTPPEASRLLDRARVGHLATAGRDGRPHVVPVCYAHVGGALYFVVDEKPKSRARPLKRMRNLLDNPRAAVVVDHWDEDWSRLEYVLLRGPAETVGSESEWGRAVEALRERYPQYRSMALSFERNPVVRVAIESVHHWRASG